MAKKAVESGTQGRKNKDLKMHIDLTGSNKVSILDKSPLDKSPPNTYVPLCLLPVDNVLIPQMCPQSCPNV